MAGGGEGEGGECAPVIALCEGYSPTISPSPTTGDTQSQDKMQTMATGPWLAIYQDQTDIRYHIPHHNERQTHQFPKLRLGAILAGELAEARGNCR